MIIAQLRNLNPTVVEEIVGLQSEADYDKLISNLYNGNEIAVLRCVAEPLPPTYAPYSGCYDVVFSDGSEIDGLSGYYIDGILCWRAGSTR